MAPAREELGMKARDLEYKDLVGRDSVSGSAAGLVGSALMIVVSALIALRGWPWGLVPPWVVFWLSAPVFGTLGVVLFGAVAFRCLQGLDGRVRVVVGREGVRLRGLGGQWLVVPWAEVRGVEARKGGYFDLELTDPITVARQLGWVPRLWQQVKQRLGLSWKLRLGLSSVAVERNEILGQIERAIDEAELHSLGIPNE